MLSIKAIGSTSTEVAYYANLGAAENLDYFSNGGDRPGAWCGEGASQLGLKGVVSPNQFKNLLLGFSPDGKTNLVQIRRQGMIRRRAGWDFTITMPKGWAIAKAVAAPERRLLLDNIAREALSKFLVAVQEYCGKTRRGKNILQIEDAKMTFAVFQHDTARSVPGELPDPCGHFHVIIPNVTVREDGTTGALDSRFIYSKRMKMMLGAMFRAELSKRLDAAGIRTERPKKENSEYRASWIELECVPKSLINTMSKRRKQIEDWLSERGLSGSKAAERAALSTREKKQRFSEAELYWGWRELAAQHEFDQTTFERSISRSSQPFCQTDKEKSAVVERATQMLISQRARFSEIELLEKTAVEAQCRGLGISEIQDAVNRHLEHSDEIVQLKDEKGIPTYTTKEMLEVEANMLRLARQLKSNYSHRIDQWQVDEILSFYPTLRDEQAQAILEITTGADISCLQGVSGSGKTFLLKVCNEVLQASGFQTIGTALAARAAKNLEDGSGIRSTHIHKLLRDFESRKTALNSKSIIILDEAGMVGTRHQEQIISIVERVGAKLILVGDWQQLQPIDAGAAFRGIAERVAYSKLNQIIRQNECWARDAVHDFRNGHAFRALEAFQERGLLTIGENRDEAISRLVKDWSKFAVDRGEIENTIVLASTNAEVRLLNSRLQQKRQSHNGISGRHIEVNGYNIFEGDRVLVTRNSSVHCLQNGTTAVVTRVDGTVLSLHLESGLTVEVDTNVFESISLAYAMTIHKFQGGTCDRAFILTGDSMTDREASYVQTSRARVETRIYSDKVSGGETVSELAFKMERSRPKSLAHEYLLTGG